MPYVTKHVFELMLKLIGALVMLPPMQNIYYHELDREIRSTCTCELYKRLVHERFATLWGGYMPSWFVKYVVLGEAWADYEYGMYYLVFVHVLVLGFIGIIVLFSSIRSFFHLQHLKGLFDYSQCVVNMLQKKNEVQRDIISELSVEKTTCIVDQELLVQKIAVLHEKYVKLSRQNSEQARKIDTLTKQNAELEKKLQDLRPAKVPPRNPSSSSSQS